VSVGCMRRRALALLTWLEACRRLAVVVDCLRRGVRQHKANGALLFLDEVGDEPRSACEQWYPFEAEQRIARIEQHRGNGTGDIERERPIEQRRQEALDEPRDLDVAARHRGFRRQLQQAAGTRVAATVQRM